MKSLINITQDNEIQETKHAYTNGKMHFWRQQSNNIPLATTGL